MPLGFGFGIGTRNYNDISDDDESDDGGYAIAPLAGAAHYRETASRGAVTVTRGGAAPVIRHQPPSLAAATSPEPPSAVRVTRGGDGSLFVLTRDADPVPMLTTTQRQELYGEASQDVVSGAGLGNWSRTTPGVFSSTDTSGRE